MEILTTILIIVFVIVLTAVLFAGWMMVVLVRFMLNVVQGIGKRIFGRHLPVMRAKRIRLVACRNRDCGAPNPAEARFCRRCGSPMRAATKVIVRRAAVL